MNFLCGFIWIKARKLFFLLYASINDYFGVIIGWNSGIFLMFGLSVRNLNLKSSESEIQPTQSRCQARLNDFVIWNYV